MAKKLTFKAPSSWNRETLTPQQERQMVRDSSTAWDAARSSDNGKRSLQQIQAGAQAASPSFAARVGNIVSGSAKSTGAGFTNLGGTLFDLLHRADTKIGQANANVKASQDLKTADRYRAMLERGTLENGTPLTNETRAQLESLVKQYESRSGLYQSTNERIQAPITEDVQSVYDTADRLAAESAQDIEAAKQGTGAVGRFLVDAGVAGTQLAGDALLSALIPGAGLASMAARSAGSGAQQARQEGASLGQQVAYGLGSGLLSVATERITNLAGPFRRAFGSGVLDDALSRLPGKLSQSAAGRTVLSAIGEGGEEVVEDLVQPLLQRITYNESATQQYQDPEFLANTLYDGLIGATLGGLGGGVDLAQNAIRNRHIKINDGDRANPTSLAANGDAGTQSPPSSIRTASTSDGTSALSGDLDTVVDTGDRTGTTPGTFDTVTDGRASQAHPAPESQTPATGAGDSSGLNIPQGGGNVNQDPLVQILTGGRRVDQARLTQDQFDAAVAANERGTVGMDAAGRVYQVDPEQHIDRRDDASIRDRRVNAFQYDHPELQPYYRQAAETLMQELNGAIRGGQTETATGEYGQTYSWRTRRNATGRISGLLDGGMSYARIEAALDAIIQDKGRENNADAKRVEMVIDDMLTNGYRDSSGFISPNQDYINAKSTITGAIPTEQRGYLDGVDEPSSDGLGAADAGSINTDYDRLQAQSSRFYPEGANAARPVDVPTTDFQGNPISRSASTVMGARAIPDDVIPQIEQMIADGQLSYQQNTDRASLERATQNVQNKGFDGALEEFRSAVHSGKISKDIATLGQTLLNTAANNRDGNAVAEILSLYQTMNTNVGQSLQAMSIFRKLSPESQLYGIRRTVDNLNKKIQEINKNFQGVQIDPELLTRFTEQTDQTGRDAVMQEIYQNVADQVPSTWRDKWNAWRYLAMLGNPRTHVRNIVGNVGFQPLRFVKNEVAAGIESALSAAGVNIERTKSFGANPALYRAAWRDYENVSDVLGGSKYDDASSQVNQRRRIFSNRFLEAARKFNTRSMELEDVVFKRITYADSLAQYLHANGVTAAQLESGQVDSGLMQRARDYAGQEALKATYQDRNAISDRVVKIVRDAGPVGDAIMPFKRTPANILARGLEYSPAGLAKSIYDGLRTVTGKSDKTAAQVIDEAAAGLTGSALMALGAYLFSEGLVTGAQGDDKDDEWAELLGHQGYALELPNGTSVTLDWLAPESMPFFMGVELASSMGENGMDANAITDALKAIANPMLELSMLQSVNDLIDSVAYAEEAPLSAMIPSAIISYFSQAIPTLGGQIERTSESDRMTTYTDKNSEIPTDVQYAIGRASSRIPGIDLFQTPYIDAWGRTESSGDVLTRALNNFVNPAYSSQVDVDAVERELQKVRDATGETSVFPSRAQRYIEVNGARKDLSAEEYQTYATTKGQTSYDLVSEAIRLPEYRSMSDGEKAEYISDLYSYANAVAKRSVSAYELEGWQLNAQTAREDLGVSPAEYIALYQKYGSSIMSGQGYDKTKQAVNAGLTVQQYAEMKSGLDADGNDSVSQAEAKSYLDRQDYSRELKSDLWNIINKSWKNNPYA